MPPWRQASRLKVFGSAAASAPVPRINSSSHESAPVVEGGRPEPFAELFAVRERPLHVVVPWVRGVSEGNRELIRELGTHVAGAVLLDPNAYRNGALVT